jgi:hypothetical protein
MLSKFKLRKMEQELSFFSILAALRDRHASGGSDSFEAEQTRKNQIHHHATKIAEINTNQSN